MANNGKFLKFSWLRQRLFVLIHCGDSPGVFFGQSFHPNGTKLYSARIIPFKGAWMEFATDINTVMYAYIDRKKKFPVTTLLRAIGYDSDKAILNLFALYPYFPAGILPIITAFAFGDKQC